MSNIEFLQILQNFRIYLCKIPTVITETLIVETRLHYKIDSLLINHSL